MKITLPIANVNNWENGNNNDYVRFAYYDKGDERHLPFIVDYHMKYRDWLEAGRPLEIVKHIRKPK